MNLKYFTVLFLLASMCVFSPAEARERGHHRVHPKFQDGHFYHGYGWYRGGNFYRHKQGRQYPLFFVRGDRIYRHDHHYRYPHRYRSPHWQGYRYRPGADYGPGLHLIFQFGKDRKDYRKPERHRGQPRRHNRR